MAAKKSAANKKGKAASLMAKASREPVEEELFETVIADEDEALVVNGVPTSTYGLNTVSGGSAVQKVLSLAQRVRALQKEISN